jgi:hypothetical protein
MRHFCCTILIMKQSETFELALSAREPGTSVGRWLYESIRAQILEGLKTAFHEEFNTKDGNYIPARKAIKTGTNKVPDGTQQMKDSVQGTKKYEQAEYTAANMSESEDEPMSDSTTEHPSRI